MQFKYLKDDFFSSIVVFLVAIPLCLGIALASDVPAELGLLGGIIGGIVIGLAGGCSLQVSGPAAGLVAVVVNIVHTHGVVGLAIATAIAGALQILFGVLKIGPVFKKIPRSVVIGMLAGIGGLIILSQFLTLADIKPAGTAQENIVLISQLSSGMTQPALLLGFFTIGVILLTEFVNKKFKLQIPSALAGVLIATIVSIPLKLEILYLDLPADFFTSLAQHTLFSNEVIIDFSLVLQGVLIALIATTESLLSVNAVDQMAGTKSDYNKETIGQGVGNLVVGLLGGLPLTGVIVRSSANVTAGGKTRLSAILHGLWILLFVSFFTDLLSLIPVTALAAILVYTGFKLLNPIGIIKSFQTSPKEGLVIATTMLSIVFINLLNGVIIGLVLYGILEFSKLKQKWIDSRARA